MMYLRQKIAHMHVALNRLYYRMRLKSTDFSILSNNCWGWSAVYQPFGLPYTTPTIGLSIPTPDYLQFLENLDHYLKCKLSFITPEQSKYHNIITHNGTQPVTYPMALLGNDVEIHFIHYKNAEEAEDKWMRRAKRLNTGHLLVKLSLRTPYGDVDETLRRFTGLPFRNKVCFTHVNTYNDAPCIIYTPELADIDRAGTDETEMTLRHINIFKILNTL